MYVMACLCALSGHLQNCGNVLKVDRHQVFHGLPVCTLGHLQNCGNVLKVDRHKYVKVGYHGFQLLSAHDRKAMYNSGHQVRRW